MKVPSFSWLVLGVAVMALLISSSFNSCIYVTAYGTPFNHPEQATCPHCGEQGNYDPHNRFYRCIGCHQVFIPR